MNHDHLKGKRNELSDWPTVKAAVFASAIITDGYNGHTKEILLSSVGNKLAVVDPNKGFYYTDIDVQGLDQAELFWLVINNPCARNIYKQVKCI